MLYYIKLDGNNISHALTTPTLGYVKLETYGSPLPSCINENYKFDGEKYYYCVNDDNSGFNSFIKCFVDTKKLTHNDVYEIAKNIYNDFNLYKSIKINKLSADCNADILGGFTSSAKCGIEKKYDFDSENQINLGNLFSNIALGLILDGTLTYHAKGENCESWSNAEFQHLYSDAMKFKTERIQKYKSLKEQVLKCENREQVDSIVW